MAVKLANGKARRKYYSVAGPNLAIIDQRIKKKGPKDQNNKRQASVTTTTMKIELPQATYEGNGAIVAHPKGGYEATAKFKNLRVVFTTLILAPKLGSPGALSRAAQMEWKRYVGAVMDHESYHIVKGAKEAAKIVKELSALRGKGHGATKGDAAKAAANELNALVLMSYSSPFLDARLQAVHNKFDKSTNHGAKSGARLNTNIQ